MNGYDVQPTLLAGANARLSKREWEIVDEICKGLSNKEIANQLFVTEKTVKFHLTNIYKKRQVKTRTQLFAQEIEARRLDPGRDVGRVQKRPALVAPEIPKPEPDTVLAVGQGSGLREVF